MGAPAGNQFWKLRAKHGRDRLFETPSLLWEAACEYFQWCEDNPLMEAEQVKGNSLKLDKDADGKPIVVPNIIELPKMRAFTLQGLCLFLDCNTVYFNHFDYSLKDRKDEISKDFSQIITRIREVIYTQKFTGAAAGFLNPNIIARDLGLSDKQETRKVDKDGNDVPEVPPLNITVTTPGANIAQSEEEA